MSRAKAVFGWMRRLPRFASAVAMPIAVCGCELTGPARRDSFTLARVKGRPLPYTISRSRGLVDTNVIAEVRWVRGTLVMFVGGRLDWDLTSDVLFNGVPRDDILPHRDHNLGPYRIDSESLFFGDFEGKLTDGGRTLSMKDKTGLHDFATFEFERR